MKEMTLPALLLAAGMALAGPLAAQPAVVVEAGGLRLACGGIGVDESRRMRAEAGLHALTIVFATVEGGYLADVAVRLDDPLGDQRVEASCGPVGVVDVAAAGRYRLTARYGGITQEHWLELAPGGGARLALRWLE